MVVVGGDVAADVPGCPVATTRICEAVTVMASRSTQSHRSSLASGGRHRLETHSGPLIVPTLVITEVAYLIGTRLGVVPEVRFLGDLAAGNLIVEPVAAADRMRTAELVAQYCDLPFGTVDAAVVAAAERLGANDLATIDR